MAKFSARVRRVFAEWAVVEHAKGRSYTDIAEEVGVDRHTIKKWIESEYAIRSEYRSASDEREKAIAHYDLLIREGWRRLRRLDDRSTNVPGLLNAIRLAQARIDRLTGAELLATKFPVVLDADHEITIVWDDTPPLCFGCGGPLEEEGTSPNDL